MSMKCIPLLAASVDIQNTFYIVDKLIEFLLSRGNSNGTAENTSTKAMRDVSSLVLKAIIGEVDPNGQKAVCLAPHFVPRLVKFVSSTRAVDDDVNILIESLEVLHDVLHRMGTLVSDLHSPISEAFFAQLVAPNQLVRKRAISCLGALTSVCDASLFQRITDKIIVDLQQPPHPEARRTTVLAIRAISRMAGHRLNKNLAILAPIIFNLAALNMSGEDDDLQEYCLQALESFCLRSRREMILFAPTLAKHVVLMARYDPNYIDEQNDDDEDPVAEGMAEDDDNEHDYDDDDYSDDDDMSWKVRRGAIKCLHAAITSQLCPPDQLCREFGPFLVSRFKEREEQVKLDVFSAFLDLLRLCNTQTSSNVSFSGTGAALDVGEDIMAVDQSDAVDNVLSPLLTRSPQVIRSIRKELNSRSAKTRIKAMTLTRELVAALPTIAEPLMSQVIKEVISGLMDLTTALKTETLLLLKQVVNGGGANTVREHIENLLPRVLAAADDRYYKVTAECLRFCSAAVFAFGLASIESKRPFSALAPAIHDAAVKRATAQDQDSEVKEAALQCLGGTVSNFGSSLGDQRLTHVSLVLKDRINNEVTRLEAVRALRLIAASESAEILTPIMPELTGTLCTILRKNNQTLKIAALELLCVVLDLPSEHDTELITNTSELIVETDLRVAALALKLSSNLVKCRGNAVAERMACENGIYPRALQLASSSLLQGRAVQSLLVLLRNFAEVNAEPITVHRILRDLKESTSLLTLNFATSVSHTSKLYCIAKCVVVVCAAAELHLRNQIVQDIIDMVTSDELTSRVFSLACLGELGRKSLFPRGGQEKETVQRAILSALDAAQEEVKTAAALSLGCLSAGNSGSGIPNLVLLIKERPLQTYLLLLSLKEAIASSSAADINPHVSLLIPFLVQQSDISLSANQASTDNNNTSMSRASEKESVRTAAAECFGRLAQLSPEAVQALASGATSKSAEVRTVVTGALKFAISTGQENSAVLFSSIRSCVGVFINLIGDADVGVAKNAIQIVNSLAKSRPDILLPHLSSATQLIYARTPKDKNLIRVVDLGPFKHEDDYGLDLRKSAFDCMRTFITGPLRPSIPLTTMLENVITGLRDHADIRAIAHLILAVSALTESAPQMVNVIEPIVKALDETFKEKVKENAVRQESERHEDSIRGALRAVRMMDAVPEISAHRGFKNLMFGVVRTRYLEKYESICFGDVEFLAYGGLQGIDTTSWSSQNRLGRSH